ncbi:MAG: LptF/LptG family permease [Bacteroidales bacterium]|nr:LptF/LptG family permease [Bacteroidales bacterium]
MTKIDWYIFWKYIGTFVFAISLLIVVVIVFDVSENVGDFIKNHATLKEVVFDFYIPFIPYFINLFIFLFTFISVIFFTSKMAGHTEIIAILSSGVSFWRLLKPYMVAALLLAGVSFYLGNFLIPHTDKVRREFKNKYITNLARSAGLNIHAQISPDTYVYVSSYDVKRQTGYKFTMEKFEKQTMTYKITSDKVVYDSINDKWNIVNYVEHFMAPEEYLVRGKSKDTTILLRPTDLYNILEDYEEMDLIQLKHHIDYQKMKGADNVLIYEIEMHKRLASPAAIIILTLIGAALSSRKTRGGMGLHLGIGITITFTYILLLEFSRVFAMSGGMSPVVAGWIPNIIFSIVGIYFIIKAPK